MTALIRDHELQDRIDLHRMVDKNVAGLELRADDSGSGNTLVGYPIVYNEWTEISGWEGNFLERISPKAVNRTLADRGDQVKILFNHGMDPSIGEKPLGKVSVVRSDDRGLWIEVPLADTSYNKDLRELLRIGAIDGMSFRFSVNREEWDDKPARSESNPKGLPERTVKELTLYEMGPVTFPAYQATSAGVRAGAFAAFEAWRQVHHVPTATELLTQPDTAPGVSEEVIDDTPPTLAPVGNEKRERLIRLADSMDRTVIMVNRATV